MEQREGRPIELPAPTAAPMVVAFGVALVFAGLATHAIVAAVGAVVAIAGTYEWLTQVFPEPAVEHLVPLDVVASKPTTTRTQVQHVDAAVGLVRANLPVAFYPISAGVRGGVAGSVAMAAFAVLYGVVSGHGVFYPINLLAAGFLPSASIEELSAFNATAFGIALLIHAMASLLVGVLYGALLPMLPRRPILLGGLIGPLSWTGLLHSTLALINPMLADRIDWSWFVVSQIAFGVVAGFVVSRRQRVASAQPLSWPIRAGIEAPGLLNEPGEKEGGDVRDTHES
jgi:hypothetical protein